MFAKISFAALALAVLVGGTTLDAKAQTPDGWMLTEGGLLPIPGMVNAKPASKAASIVATQLAELGRMNASPVPTWWRYPFTNENSGSASTTGWQPRPADWSAYRVEVGP